MLGQLLQTLKVRLTPVKSSPRDHCMICDGKTYVPTLEKSAPDFNLDLIRNPEARSSFVNKENGVCQSCKIWQSFNRPSLEAINYINELGKDMSTSWDGFNPKTDGQPGPMDQFNKTHFEQRLRTWKPYLAELTPPLKSALFLRPWFGASVGFIQNLFPGCKTYGLDMSPFCESYVQETYPSFKKVTGYINHRIQLDLDSNQKFDAIFSFHVFPHSVDVKRDLRQIASHLSPGGVAMFSHDYSQKPKNPFHMVHLTSEQFEALLREVFTRIVAIEGCDLDPRSPRDFLVKI